MNNNLINFINEKMEKLYKKQIALLEELSIIDTTLNSTLVMDGLSEKEQKQLYSEFVNFDMKYKRCLQQYKNLNTIRLHVLGLI